jgi:hypothetical protein
MLAVKPADSRPDSNVIVRIRSDAGVFDGQSVIGDYTAAECPSWSNLFHHNRAEGNWLRGESAPFHDLSPEPVRLCPKSPDERAYRIRMWDNDNSPRTM